MRNILLTILALVVTLAVAPSGVAQTGADPGHRDTLWVDTVVSYVSGIGVVPITFYNDETLSTIEVTLKHSSTQVQVDSFSFVGSRVSLGNANNLAQISDDSTIVTVLSALTTNLLEPGRGLLGTLYCSYSNSIAPQGIVIDTFRWNIGPIQHSTSFKPSSTPTTPFIPHFVPGYLDIQAAPATFDSVWVGDVDGVAGQPVVVDIGAYNERRLAKLALALDYGSELLRFDSVSFAGTRGESAPTKTIQPFSSVHKLYIVLNFGDALALPAGAGTVAALHFTIDPTAPDDYIDIDSTTVGIGIVTSYNLTSLDGSEVIYPLFRSGGVDVTATTDVEDITAGDLLPTEYALSQNYPNPFNPSTQFELSLPAASDVRLEVFNVLGQRVRTLVEDFLPAGIHRITFDGLNSDGELLSSGVYFYRVTSESYTATRKMMLVK